MVATVNWQEYNGVAPGSPTTKTSINFCSSDNNNPGVLYPIRKPLSGTNYSYVKSYKVNVSVAPDTSVSIPFSSGWSLQ